MSTAKEPGPAGTTSPPSQPGQTWVKRIELGAGSVSLLAAAIIGALKAVGDVAREAEGAFKVAKDILERLHLHGPVPWAATIALGVLGACLLYLGTRKRSRVLRPEALGLRADDPAHLRGRDDDLTKLTQLCRDRSLVFLVGESGAGKSSLVRAGLCRPGKLPPTIAPILVDVWGDDWSEGPARRLAEAIRTGGALSDDDRAKLELAPGARLPSILAAIKRIKAKLGRVPLLIFDQFDDYQVRHRARFRDDESGTWKTFARVAAENPFWKGIADLAREENAHVLIVTRSDAADGLLAVQFAVEPASYPLGRPSASVVRPLLDDLTRPDQPGGAVVADPENGWDQLKERLGRDLEEDGQVLPIQLRSVLAGLPGLPTLTPAAYQRAGGVRGLEARAVEAVVAEAARESGIGREGVIRILKALVDVRKRKTVPRPAAVLREAGGANGDELKKALNVLETRELVRSVPGSDHDDVSWRLDHDYLSHPVLEVERRSDRWNVLLRDAHQSWIEAHGDLRKRWRALLSPPQQAALLWQRLRGRCHFGPARGYWWLSLLRMAPYLPVIAAAWFLSLAYLDQRDEAEAREMFKLVGRGYVVSSEEMKECFWPLALESREGVRWHFLKVGLENPENAERLQRRTELVCQASVGWNARFRSRVINQLLLEIISRTGQDPKTILACADIGRSLHAEEDHRAFVAAIGRALAEAIQREPDAGRLSRLSWAFAGVAKLATPEQAGAVAGRLAEAIRGGPDPYRLSALSETFAGVAKFATPEQAGAVIRRLTEAIQGESDPDRLSLLSGAFAGVAKLATPEQAGAVIRRLAEAIQGESDAGRLSALSEAFAEVAKFATPEQAGAVAGRLAEMIKGEPSVLSGAFAGVAKLATPEQAGAVIRRLAEAIQGEAALEDPSALAFAFAEVAKLATPEQAGAVAGRLAEAIRGEPDAGRLSALSEAFAEVAKFATPEQGGAVAGRLAEAIRETPNPFRLSRLSGAFAGVAKFATPEQGGAVAGRLAEAIRGGPDAGQLSRLFGAFAEVAKLATPEQGGAVAGRLAEAIQGEPNPFRLSRLSEAFAEVAKFATPEQGGAVAGRLAEAIQGESDPYRLSALSGAFAGVAKLATPEQAGAVIRRLAEAIRGEPDAGRLSALSEAFAEVAKFATPEQAGAVAGRLAEAIRGGPDPDQLSALSEALAGVAKFATPEQGGAVAGRLAEAIRGGPNADGLSPLSGAFAGVAKFATPEQAGHFFRDIGVAMRSRGDSSEVSSWARCIAALPDPLDPSDLANVLKYPNCIDPVRSAVLVHLAGALKIPWKAGDDPWKIINHEKFKPYLNRPLVAPPDWPAN